jgi:hypothetical protein
MLATPARFTQVHFRGELEDFFTAEAAGIAENAKTISMFYFAAPSAVSAVKHAFPRSTWLIKPNGRLLYYG